MLLLTVVHFIVALLLIVMVLVQDSKGGGVFGMGSTGSNKMFSATGAADMIVKFTRGLAIAFAATCIALTYMTTNKSGSVTDDFVPAAAAPTAPATPESPAAAPTPTSTEKTPQEPSTK